MKGGEFRIDHMIFGLSMAAITSCALLSCPYVNNESAFILIIFNFLFVLLTFPLNGALLRKSCMLLMGNIIGLIWNYVFSLFAVTAVNYFGGFLGALYLFFNPFLNLIWIVSFWSISLTVLVGSKNRRAGFSLDN